MFNLVMGVLMGVIGIICFVLAYFSDEMAVKIFFGCAMFIFGIVEIIRSKSIRERKKHSKDREFEQYMKMAEMMGVVINPITGEVVSKKEEKDECLVEENAEE